jgi:hypothetical protein
MAFGPEVRQNLMAEHVAEEAAYLMMARKLWWWGGGEGQG